MSEDRALSELEASFAGDLVPPDDATYDRHRAVWNGSIDRHPALIARCIRASDVSAAVTFARRIGLPLAIKGGGHSFPGQSVCDDGIVIDLGEMKGIDIDPQARTARAEAGVLLGELDHETQAYGLAVPAGIVTHTGLAGLTLGGGIGWLQRKYGLTIDQLLSVDLITAEGELVKRVKPRTPISSGASAAEAGTSASSPSSSSTSTRSVRIWLPGRCSGRLRSRRTCCASTGIGSPRRRTI